MAQFCVLSLHFSSFRSSVVNGPSGHFWFRAHEAGRAGGGLSRLNPERSAMGGRGVVIREPLWRPRKSIINTISSSILSICPVGGMHGGRGAYCAQWHPPPPCGPQRTAERERCMRYPISPPLPSALIMPARGKKVASGREGKNKGEAYAPTAYQVRISPIPPQKVALTIFELKKCEMFNCFTLFQAFIEFHTYARLCPSDDFSSTAPPACVPDDR